MPDEAFVGVTAFPETRAIMPTTLLHHPLCPQSRFVRLIIGELTMEVQLQEEVVEARRPEFLGINPAGTLPVLIEHDGQVVPGAAIIAEYLDETRGLVLDQRRLLPEDPAGRVEVRRLMEWFGQKFHAEASGPIVGEKIMKRLLPADLGGGSPDTAMIRAAQSNIRYHLQYLGHLLTRRNWLAGDKLSYADLMAAAHLSVVDFLGDVPWDVNETARAWYARVKSRPSFRPILADRLRGIQAATHYADLDF